MMQAVVFDLDGVLIDSEPVWEEVRRAYVTEHGGTWQPDSQSRLMGMSTSEWARYLSEELGVSVNTIATHLRSAFAPAVAPYVPVALRVCKGAF